MNTEKTISSSREDYLETIYLFEKENQQARVGKIAEALCVKKSSVTEALQNLAKEGFVNYIPYSPITLTNKGKEAAEKILRKHNILKNFFSNIFNLSDEASTETACKIEHVINENVAQRFDMLQSLLLENETNSKLLAKLHKQF